jgi:S1-C subfamily serine protease
MRWRQLTIAGALLAGMLAPPPAHAGANDGVERALRAASVLVGSGCSGVLAEGPDLVLTAEHCIPGRQSVELRFSDGATRTGWVVAIDHVADQALVLLEQPVALTPLMIVRNLPVGGTVLYFEGRPSEPRFQEAKLEKVGRCPSLPALPNALFTTIAGVPGDSGAAIVDAGARVVGLVHGGAQCQIATPADTLLRLVDHFFASDEIQLPAPPG